MTSSTQPITANPRANFLRERREECIRDSDILYLGHGDITTLVHWERDGVRMYLYSDLKPKILKNAGRTEVT